MADKYYRLVSLIVNICPLPLRELFHLCAQNDPKFTAPYSAHSYMLFRQSDVMTARNIRRDQYDKIYPQNGQTDVSDWDITQLATILKLLFVKQISQMSQTILTNMDIMREVRNDLQHIASASSVSDADFNKQWNALQDATLALANDVKGSAYKEYIQKKIDKAKTSNMPELGNVLCEWYEEKSAILENEIHQLKTEIKQLREEHQQEMKDVKERLSDVAENARSTKTMLYKGSRKHTNYAGRSTKRFKTVDYQQDVMQRRFSETMRHGLPSDNPISFIELSYIIKKLREDHFVVVCGSRRSLYLKAALTVIKNMGYAEDRCFELSKASDWYHVSFEEADCIVVVNPFGKVSFDQHKASAMSDIFDSMLSATNDEKYRDFTFRDIVIISDKALLNECKKYFGHKLLGSEITILDNSHILASKDPQLNRTNIVSSTGTKNYDSYDRELPHSTECDTDKRRWQDTGDSGISLDSYHYKKTKVEEGKKQAEKETTECSAVSKSVLGNETISAEHTNLWKIDPNAWMKCLEEGNIEYGTEALLQNKILPDNAVLNKICLEETCRSNIVQTICHTVCDFIKQKSSTISHVWPAHRNRSVKPGPADENREVIFAVLTSQSVHITDFQTYQRCIDEISDKCQSENDAVYRKQQHSMLEREELCKLQTCVRENAKDLMKKHSNLTKVAASWIKASGFDDANPCMKEIPCIALYVHIKDLVPINEEPFEETIGGYPIDVREGVFTLCGKANDLHQNVKMGCEIDSGFGTQQGTIGPFIKFETDTNIYFLTSAHVVLNATQVKTLKESQDGCIYYGKCGTETFQPPESQTVEKENKRHILGKIELAVYKEGTGDEAGMEIALVLINEDRVPIDGSFPDNSSTSMNEIGPGNFHYSSGEIFEKTKLTHTTTLFKFGSTSGLTKGRCIVNGTSVRRNSLQDTSNGFDITLHNQIEIESLDPYQPFAKQGDSGSLVLARDGEHLAAVGIFEGIFNRSFMVTPIEDIVRVLSVSLSRYKNQPRGSADEMEVEEFGLLKPITLHFVPRYTQVTANQEIKDEVTKQTTNLETNIIHRADHTFRTIKSELTAIKQHVDKSNIELKQHLDQMQINLEEQNNKMEQNITKKIIESIVNHRENV